MNYFPGTSHFKVQVMQYADLANPTVKTQSTLPIHTFVDRLQAEHCVQRLSRVHAFEGYVLIEESLRSFSHEPTVLNSTVYDAEGSVIPPSAAQKRAAASR
jgi:hypothetical protein